MDVSYQSKQCRKCGRVNPVSAKFCGYCGSPMKSNRLTGGLLIVLCAGMVLAVLAAGFSLWGKFSGAKDGKDTGTQFDAESLAMIQESAPVESALMEKNTFSAYYFDLIAIQNDGRVLSTNNGLDLSDFYDVVSVAMGSEYALGLRSDGTVALATSAEFYYEGFDSIANWTDIVAIAAGYSHAAGLKADGTVVAAGDNIWGQCDVSDWTDIVAIDVSWDYPITIGVKSDGTLVACGRANTESFAGWSDIVDIEYGRMHAIGVKSDGTVMCEYTYGMEDTSRWTDIVSVSTGSDIVAGLKSDGSVVVAGDDYYGQCNVTGWTDIVAAALGSDFTVGLKSDGTVVHAGNWRNDLSRVMENVRLPNKP